VVEHRKRLSLAFAFLPLVGASVLFVLVFILESVCFALTILLLGSLRFAFLVKPEILGIFVLKHSLTVLAKVEVHLCQANQGIFLAEIELVEDALLLPNCDGIFVVFSCSIQQLVERSAE
jgi:hypothetical protein